MKTKDLKACLAGLSKKELTAIVINLYKELPKSKRVDPAFLADLMDVPMVDSVEKKSSSRPLSKQIHVFTQQVRQQYYFYPNEVVSKKERHTWAPTVVTWYHRLLPINAPTEQLIVQATALEELYHLLCDACVYEYFHSDDPFLEIGIRQVQFYESVLELWKAAKGALFIVEKGINLIIDNPLNTYTLYSNLMESYLQLLDDPAFWRQGIAAAKIALQENGLHLKPQQAKLLQQHFYSQEDSNQLEVHNNLVELIYRLHVALGEMDQGIFYFDQHYCEVEREVQLYVLVRLLFEQGAKQQIRKHLEQARQQGIELRPSLVQLLMTIEHQNILPHVMS